MDGNNGRRRGNPILPILLILFLLGSLVIVLILVFNVFGIRDRYILPPLQNLPIVGNMFQGGAEDDYVEFHPPDEDEPVTAAQAPSRNNAEENELLAEIEHLRTQLSQERALNEQLSASNETLTRYRDSVYLYTYQRRRLEEATVNENPEAFVEFFRAIEPELAARLYQQINVRRHIEREFRRFARTYHEMNARDAAQVFSAMLHTNPELLVQILSTFDPVYLARVYNAMEAEDVAIISQLMVPDADTSGLLPEIPMIVAQPPPTPPPVPLIDNIAEDVDETEDYDEESDVEEEEDDE